MINLTSYCLFIDVLLPVCTRTHEDEVLIRCLMRYGKDRHIIAESAATNRRGHRPLLGHSLAYKPEESSLDLDGV